MASSRPKFDPYEQKQLSLVDLAGQPATPSAQNATSTWAFSPARPSNFHFGRAPAATSAPTPSAHATAAAVRSPPAQTDYEKMARKLSGTFDGKLQTVAKIAAVSAAPLELRYLGRISHIGCLAAMIIAVLCWLTVLYEPNSALGR